MPAPLPPEERLRRLELVRDNPDQTLADIAAELGMKAHALSEWLRDFPDVPLAIAETRAEIGDLDGLCALAVEARAEGLNHSDMCRRLNIGYRRGLTLLARAAERGIGEPGVRPQPLGRSLYAVTTHTVWDKETGQARVAQVWDKAKTTREMVEANALEACTRALSRYEGLCPLIPPPDDDEADLLRIVNIADVHFGMFAWKPESGENYDLRIARRQFRESTSSILLTGPSCAKCIVLVNGDFLHADNDDNRTPASHHALDGDGRHDKVLDAAVESLIDVGELAAQRHRQVQFVLLKGNHDPVSITALRVALKYHFSRNERIAVHDSPALWWADTWGTNLIAATHGHTLKGKKAKAAHYVAANFRRLWGQTDRTFIFLGHDHHEHTHDEMGALVETTRPFTPRDAYAAGAFVSEREISALTLHKTRGRRRRDYEALPL